jgi:flagellin
MTRINTNIPSLVAQHRMGATQKDLNLRLERLSTGLRINTGKDDPAGLIASETLRSEIRGIAQAVDNSQRVINVLATAEGAINEVSALLIEIRGLINKSANRGALSEDEIRANQLQIDSLLESIDRIAGGTQFNTKKLIDGSLGYLTSGVDNTAIAGTMIFGARVPQSSNLAVRVDVTASAEKGTLAFNGATLTQDITIELTGNKGAQVFNFASGTAVATLAEEINKNAAFTGVVAVASAGGVALQSAEYGSAQFVRVKALEGDFIASSGQEVEDTGEDVTATINGQNAFGQGLLAGLRANGLDLEVELTEARATALGASTFYINGGGAVFQIGPDVSSNGQIHMGIPSLRTSNLGTAQLGLLNTIAQGQANDLIGTDETGENAERIINKAINQVAIIRGRLGGLQKNQIETNINSQQIALENVTAAESTIRDADMAVEISSLTRAQILVQTGLATLSLANQAPTAVLSLLG